MRSSFCHSVFQRGLGLMILLLAGSSVQSAPPAVPPKPAELVSLRVWPAQTSLWGTGASQHFLALGTFSDGLERDVTSETRFSLSNGDLASIDASGRLVARTNGTVELKAAVGGKTSSARVDIRGSGQKWPFSFARDIGSILTKHGCNSVDCHGSVKGKKGFKLSLNAAYPRDDYTWIVEGGVYKVLTTEQDKPRKPRIDRQYPEESLLLMKPSLNGVNHGGGERLKRGSVDYQIVLEWIKNGAPYGKESTERAAAIKNVEIYPPAVVLDPKGKHHLLVTATYSDGRRADMTDQVVFASTNEEVITVSPEGVVQAVRPGEAAVMVRAAGWFAAARVGVIAAPLPDYPLVQGRNLIDEHIFTKLRKFNILPSSLSTDAEFLRRVCLDVAGTLPPPQRVREFLADPDPDKRDKLIDVLLDSPEYVDFWTYRFADLFRVLYASQENLKSTQAYVEWVRNSIAQNKPYDRIARERIAAQGQGGTTQYYYRISELMPAQEIMAEQVRIFQGLRLECAQCHNHPFEAWSQDQFWGLAAFFARITVVQEGSLLIDLPGRLGSRGLTHPRTKSAVRPTFLDGKAPPPGEDDLRMSLARWITAKENPYFAKAAVNRMWGYFFHRGIVDPVDDFRSTNPPTHPELLEALARNFMEHGYDLKHLIRTIVRSRTYQLSGAANSTNREDTINYSRALPRALDAVILLDAISAVTGVEEPFVMDKSVGGGPTPPGTRAIHLVPDIAPSHFLEVYGRPSRQALPNKPTEAAVAQALHMLAGTTYNEKIARAGGRVDRLLKNGASDRQAIEELYLAALCRWPTEYERNALEKMLREQPSRKQGLEALTWALISSREFAFNH